MRFTYGWLYVLVFILIAHLFSQDLDKKHIPFELGPVNENLAENEYQKVFYVSASGSDQTGDGSKKSPWKNISYVISGIKDASSINRYAILIEEGTYIDSTIILKPFVDLYGGFNFQSDERHIYNHPTIISGNRKSRVFIGANNTRIDGFIISGGTTRGKGAGLLCEGVSPHISNNIFIHNKTLKPDPWEPELRHQIANDGGAIYAFNGAAPYIANNLFYENMTETGRGAAIALQNRCSGKISKNVFIYNKSGLNDPKRSSDGGAISVFEWSNPVIENNIILENHALAKNDGGAIFSSFWSSPTITGNIIVGNTADDDGGAIFTGGQNHHDEIPPNFDPIPDTTDFFIRITDNVFVGNYQALEFTMESRGRFANNIVAHNGGPRTVPGGVYFQRSEAQIINNTILDPFLINFKTFDNKTDSKGLKPSIIKNNRFFGSFDVQTEVIKGDNYILSDSSEVNLEKPKIMSEWTELKSDAVYYGLHLRRDIFTTMLFFYTENFEPNQFVGRVLKAGNRWSVIKSNDQHLIEVWGDLTGYIEITLFPTYHLD